MFLVIATFVKLTTIVLALFVGFLTLHAIAAMVRAWRSKESQSPASAKDTLPRFAIVIPAHDEEAGIAATVASCMSVDYPSNRFDVIVIADNCSDGTADAAGAAGARVIKREDPIRRSKGYALEFFFEESADGWRGMGHDAVVIVDADTLVDVKCLKAFARVLGTGPGRDWAQAYYTVSNPDVNWRTRLMTYALALHNGVLPLGQDRLGLGVGLKGNGMAFTASGLARFPWRAYGLVEDAEFGQMLRIAGERVRFVPEAKVYGAMVSQGDLAKSQRRRWEAGRRSLRRQFTGLLLRSPHIDLTRKALGLIDLWLPSLVVLMLFIVIIFMIHPASFMSPRFHEVSSQLIPWHFAILSGLAVYVLSPFVVLGLPVRYLADLALVPYYAVWKILVVGGRPPTSWERTGRETVVIDSPPNQIK